MTEESLSDPRRRRLLYQAQHRGTKEADKVIGGYVKRHIATMSDETLDALEALLVYPDPDLLNWLFGLTVWPEAVRGDLLCAMQAELSPPL